MIKLRTIITDKKILSRLAVTIGILLLFRLGSLITLPGASINSDVQWTDGSFLGIMNMLGGGGLTQFSIFALGVTPYITASIIMQLLSSDVIPPLARLNKQGEKGRIKVEKITRLLTIGIAILEGLAISLTLSSSGYMTVEGLFGASEWTNYFVFTLFMVVGSLISLWFADQITMKGIGNGTSMIIFIGIISIIPEKISNTWTWLVPATSTGPDIFSGAFIFVLYLVAALALVFILGFFDTSERKIPLQQTGRGLQLIENKQTYLPIKINPAGVIPVIFASAIMTLPPVIASFFSDTSYLKYWIDTYLALTAPLGLTIYALLVVAFTFFYAHINIKSDEMATNFQTSNTFIVGVKPGKETEKYISKTVSSLSVIGAVVITIVAILPYVLTMIGVPESIAIGGTSAIILVSVTIEFWDQLKARILASDSKKGMIKKTGKVKKDKTFDKELIKEIDKDIETVLFE